MYITIDSNPSITYSEVRNFLREVEKYRARLLAKGMEEVTISFKDYSQSGEVKLMFPYLAGVKMEITTPLDEAFWSYVILRWETPQGYRREFYVYLTSLRNNLGKGRAGYFLCPETRQFCRKLYTDGISLYSRYAFRSIYYNSQSASRNQRIAMGSDRAERKAEEAQQHKQTYKGKPTRWAKIAEREKEKADSYDNAAYNAFVWSIARFIHR